MQITYKGEAGGTHEVGRALLVEGATTPTGGRREPLVDRKEDAWKR